MFYTYAYLRTDGSPYYIGKGTYHAAQQPHIKVVFQNLFPVNLTLLQFDSQVTDITYLKASVTFKYTVYNITDIICC